jgi:hypothetical protein
VNARSDVYAVAPYIVRRKENVADVDADAHAEFAIVLQRGLHLARTVHSVERAVKTRERAIANLSEHPTVVLWQQGLQDLAVLGERAKSRMLVAAHDRRVARDVAKHDRGEFARWDWLKLAH